MFNRDNYSAWFDRARENLRRLVSRLLEEISQTHSLGAHFFFAPHQNDYSRIKGKWNTLAKDAVIRTRRCFENTCLNEIINYLTSLEWILSKWMCIIEERSFLRVLKLKYRGEVKFWEVWGETILENFVEILVKWSWIVFFIFWDWHGILSIGNFFFLRRNTFLYLTFHGIKKRNLWDLVRRTHG